MKILLGLMSNKPLLISSLIEHADRYHGNREIVSRLSNGKIDRSNYAKAHSRSKKLAKALIKYETIDTKQITAIMDGKEPQPPEDWHDSDKAEPVASKSELDAKPDSGLGKPAEQH